MGEKVKNLRLTQKVKLYVLTEKLGISESQIYKYETGKNRIPAIKLAIFSKIFKVPMEYFIGEIGEVKDGKWN
jgi:transcriptional regulator with XRE-family HTH domain